MQTFIIKAKQKHRLLRKKEIQIDIVAVDSDTNQLNIGINESNRQYDIYILQNGNVVPKENFIDWYIDFNKEGETVALADGITRINRAVLYSNNGMHPELLSRVDVNTNVPNYGVITIDDGKVYTYTGLTTPYEVINIEINNNLAIISATSLEDEDIEVDDEPAPLLNTEQHGSGEVQYLKQIDKSVDTSNIVVMAYQNEVLRNVRRIDDNIIGIIDGKSYVFGEGKEHSKGDIEIYTIVPYKTDIRLINEKKIDIKIL